MTTEATTTETTTTAAKPRKTRTTKAMPTWPVTVNAHEGYAVIRMSGSLVELTTGTSLWNADQLVELQNTIDMAARFLRKGGVAPLSAADAAAEEIKKAIERINKKHGVVTP